MESYDEDLTENAWYSTLCLKHEDLFHRATNERWMICIPRIGSWKNPIEDGDLFSQKCFESHILKPVMVYTNNGMESSMASDNKYITYNGKEVIIRGSKIFCVKGFDYNYNQPSFETQSENLTLNVETCHTSTILFEETFFNQNDESYPVLCLSDPLEPHMVLSRNGTKEEAQSVESPKSKLENSFLWQRANHPKRLRQMLEEKIKQFITSISDHRYSSSSMKELEVLTEAVSNFQAMCLQIALRDNKLRKLPEASADKEAIKHALEDFVMHGIGRIVRGRLNELFATSDSHFNKLTRNLSSITLHDLGIKDIFSLSLPRAGRELSRLNRCATASEKLSCLQKAILHLSSKQDLPGETSPVTYVDGKGVAENAVAMKTCRSENTALSSDDLLPILIYLVIKSDVNNWWANFYYVKHFHFTGSRLDQSGFYIATLEAALEHVKNGNIEVNRFGPVKRSNSRNELTSLFNALKSGEVDVVKRLLRQADAMRSLQEHDKCHPLCECPKCQHISERSSADVSQSDITIGSRDDKGRTPLHIACITGKHELVEALVSLDADLNSSDYHGATPLHLAAQEGNQSAIFLLLHYGANPNAEDNNKNTPLHLACVGGHDTCVKALLFYDPVSTVVKVNAANDVGDTPLFIASKWGYVSIVTCLMEYGADPHQSNRRNFTPFNISHNSKVSYALRNTEVNNSIYTSESPKQFSPATPGKATTKRMQKRSMSTIQSRPPTDEEIANKQIDKLIRAVADSDINMVKFVCGWDSNPQRQHVKCHPLCQCFKCQPPLQDVYLHANSSDVEGRTPLVIASKLGDFDMVKLLLKHGAKTDVKTKAKSHSPLHLAAQYGHEKIVEVLLAAGASFDVRDADGCTPVYMCAMNGHCACAKLLLKAGASLNLRNHRGDSPLHEAVRWKRSDTARLLIEHGALGYYRNKKGQTVRDLAAQDPELKELLEQSFSAHDIWQDANVTTQSTNHQLRSSHLRQSDADELLAKEIFNQFQAAPTTPPMIDVSPDQSKVFDFDQDASNSFLEALSSSTPEKRTPDKVAKETQRLLSNPDATSCGGEKNDDSSRDASQISPDSSLTSNVVLLMSNPTFDSNFQFVSSVSENKLPQSSLRASKTTVQSDSSTPESSYFEISLKNLPEKVTESKTNQLESAADSAQSENFPTVTQNEADQSEGNAEHLRPESASADDKDVSTVHPPSHDNLYLSLSEQQQDNP